MKEKVKSAGFWVSVISSVFLILGAFGVEIGDDTASAVINGICSLLVMFGIIVPGKSGTKGEDCEEINDDCEADSLGDDDCE